MRSASTLVAALLSAGACGVASCQPPAPEPGADPVLPSAPALDLQDGASVVFIGDSITQKALFTQHLETFFLTRHPDRKIRFSNAGVDGERAADVLKRLDADILEAGPTHALVLLGMNDAGYSAWKSSLFAAYQADMTTLADRLDAAGVRVSLLSPTLFDSRVSRLADEPGKEPGISLYNGALAYYGEWCRELAIQRGFGFADLQAPLARITGRQRRTDPRFTLVPDAVHPDANGGVIKAVTILDEIFAPPGPVSAIEINLSPGGAPACESTNGTINWMPAPDEGDVVAFDFQARSLPWIVPVEAQIGFELTEAGPRFNSEPLRIRGLPPGRYALMLNSSEAGQWTDEELAAGINLQGNPRTPQYQRAFELAQSNAERNATLVQAHRNWWADKTYREHVIAGAEAAEPRDEAAIALLREEHVRWMAEEFGKKMPEARDQSVAAWDALMELARKPLTVSYRLRRVP